MCAKRPRETPINTLDCFGGRRSAWIGPKCLLYDFIARAIDEILYELFSSLGMLVENRVDGIWGGGGRGYRTLFGGLELLETQAVE